MNGKVHYTDLEEAIVVMRRCLAAVTRAGQMAQALGNGVTAFNEATGLQLASKEEADAVGPVTLRRLRKEALSQINILKTYYGIVVEVPDDWQS